MLARDDWPPPTDNEPPPSPQPNLARWDTALGLLLMAAVYGFWIASYFVGSYIASLQ